METVLKDENGRPHLGKIPPLVLALAQVLSTNRRDLKPFPFRPPSFDARDDLLLREKSYTIYDEMFRDSTVRDSLRGVNAPLLRNWSVLPGDPDDPTSERVAQFCSEVLERMDGGFLRRFRKLLNARRYGIAVLEPEWKIQTRGRWAGMTVYKDWHYRLPHFLDPRRNPETGVVEIRQRQPDQSEKVIPADRAILFTWIDDLDPLRGEGDLRACYRAWWLKDTCLKLVAIHAEMIGTGRPSVSWDPNVVDELSDDHIVHAKSIVENFQKALGIMLLPGMQFEFLEGTPAADHYLQIIEYADEEIRRTIGKPKLLSEQDGSTGSYSLVEQQKGHQSAELAGEIQNDLEDLFVEQILRPLLFWNAIPEEYLPRFSLAPPASEEASLEKVAKFYEGVREGVIKARTGDEDWLRQQLGAPLADEAGEVESPASRQANGEATQELAQMIFGRKARVRPAHPIRVFAREDELERALDRHAAETASELNQLLGKLLRKLGEEVVSTFIEGDLEPDEVVSAIRSLRFDLDPWARKLYQSGKQAYRIGKEWAESSLTRTFAPSPVNASGIDDLGSYDGLLQSRSFTISEGMEAEVLQKLKSLLETAYRRGEDYRETRRALNDLFNDLAGGRIIGPGSSPGSTFQSPLVQETTIRTVHADAADKAKVDVYRRNESLVIGIERKEFIEGDRNHPLSKHVDGLRIPMDHPLVNEFIGALHYNERGGTVPITVREAESPGFRWSSEGEIRSALAKKRKLSPRF